MKRLCLLSLTTLGLAAQLQAQTNFNTYVSIGDSLAAGYSSSSLVEHHQRNSVPAHLARQAGVADFQMPLVGAPGIPPELTLVSLSPGPVIVPRSATSGAPQNLTLARPYNNLAVPGATAVNALTTVTDGGGLHDLILRGLGTQVQQAVALHPTFITVWIGNNDVLGAAVRGRAIDGVTLTPTDTFRDTYAAIIAGLRTSGAFIIAANLGDVTTIPFVTTIKPYVTDPNTGQPVLAGGQRIPLLGPAGPLPSNAYVLLTASSLLAQGIGLPTAVGGNGQPLPDEVVLDPSEVAIIQDHISVNNASIASICAAAGVRLFDVNAVLRRAATSGIPVGGVELNTNFLTGGIFSYDGVHPSDLGYALVANEWIAAINAAGGNLAPVDLSAYMGVSGAALRPAAAPFEFSREAAESLLAAFPRVDGR